MPMVNVERILNESPKKRLIIGWNKLKQNFTESEAANYQNIYKDQPLSFILENSNMIFTEPYFGRGFYKEVFEHAAEYPYPFSVSGEVGKVKEYITTYEAKMSDTQMQEYKELLSFMESTMASVDGLLFEETAGAEVEKDRILKLSDALYSHDADTVVEEFTNVTSASVFFSFLPAVYECTKDASFVLNETKRFSTSDAVLESETLNEENFTKFVENSLVIGKLTADDRFMESVNALPRTIRILYTGYKEENIMEHAQELTKLRLAELPVGPVITPEHAVNSIFTDIVMEFTADNNRELKQRNEKLMGIMYGKLFDQVYQEYVQSDDTSSQIHGYPFFESMTIEDAFHYVTEKDNQYNYGNPSKVVAQHSTDAREEEEPPKKAKAPSSSYSSYNEPEKKDLATRIQNKAMDFEAKQMSKMANREEKGQKIKGAIKAVTNIPANIMNKLKQAAHDWDVADDDRRKQYIIEPGFRKKAFRNLKLAIMYGATASVSVLYLPVAMILRHYSKEKDKRIRVELARELDTEIKVTEEKIADANANGDQKQKYQLMRLKSQMEAEALRVKTNSKYV